MKINLKEKISKVKQIKSPESAMENPEQTMDVPDDVMIECESLVKIYKTKDIEAGASRVGFDREAWRTYGNYWKQRKR